MTILGIDRWKKRLWLVYTTWKSSIIFPLWSLDNNTNVLYDVAHIVVKHHIDTIVVWYPSQASFVTKSIDSFIKNLWFVIDPSIVIHKENEDYSSIEAGALLWDFKKTAAEDTIAAGIILGKFIARCGGELERWRVK
jgi:RNase H-fold protein (predicted Holliday junction resolvase)